MRNYRIHRECWSEKTYNGYVDSPYWRIDFQDQSVGLKDSGEWWAIQTHSSNSLIEEYLQDIIDQCHLDIKLQRK